MSPEVTPAMACSLELAIESLCASMLRDTSNSSVTPMVVREVHSKTMAMLRVCQQITGAR